MPGRLFWKPVLWTGLIVFLLGEGFLLVYYKVFVPENNNIMRFKEVLFLAAAGEALKAPTPVPFTISISEEEIIAAKSIGSFLRSRYQQGVPFPKLLDAGHQAIPIDERESFWPATQKALIWFANTNLKDHPSAPLLMMVSSGGWAAFLNDTEAVASLNEILAGKAGIPKPSYKNPNDRNFEYFILLLSVQFVAFISYLIARGFDESGRTGHFRWYQAPWRKAGTYVEILLISPGAWPLMIIGGLFELPVIFRKTFRKTFWETRRVQRREKKRERIELKLRETHGSAQLLSLLKERVGGGGESE